MLWFRSFCWVATKRRIVVWIVGSRCRIMVIRRVGKGVGNVRFGMLVWLHEKMEEYIKNEFEVLEGRWRISEDYS